MPNRYYIGNPLTILKPDAYESVFAVDSSVWRTTLNTVAIGIRKQNLAGGADANESKAF